jgi:hypothetical protein
MFYYGTDLSIYIQYKTNSWFIVKGQPHKNIISKIETNRSNSTHVKVLKNINVCTESAGIIFLF